MTSHGARSSGRDQERGYRGSERLFDGTGYGKMLEEPAQAIPSGTPIDRKRMDGIMRRYDSIPAARHATTRK